MPLPSANELAIQNCAVAINPIDALQSSTGLFLSPSDHPVVLGYDVAGIVHEVGSAVTKFKPGDRVIAHAWSIITKKPEDGGFALFTKVQAGTTARLPEGVKFKEGGVGFGLPLPTLTMEMGAPQTAGKVLVVYDGSSAVGMAVTQLATASGVRVIAIASERSHELCKSLGASQVFDQKDLELVGKIVDAVKSSASSPTTANDNDTLLGIYDAISEPSTYSTCYSILAPFPSGGSTKLVIVHPPPAAETIPEGIKVESIFALGEFCFPLWESFVPEALERGVLQVKPEAEVVGKELGSLQRGLERWREGVSARKIVVEL